MNGFCTSALWDPNIWIHEKSDFTKCFQLTVLVWVPFAILWLLLLLEIFNVSRRNISFIITWSFLSIFKVFTGVLLILSALLDFGFAIFERPQNHGKDYLVHLVTPVMKTITYVATIYLVIFHRKQGLRTSGSLFSLWTILIIFGIPQLRSVLRSFYYRSVNDSSGQFLLWNNYESVNYLIYYGLVVINFLLNCFADKSLDNVTVGKNPSPELSASFIRKIFFQWYDPFLWRGFKKTIEPEDVWDLKNECLTKNLNAQFDKYWKDNDDNHQPKETSEKKSNVCRLLMTLYETAGYEIWTTGLLKLINNLLLLIAPQVLGILIGFISSNESIDQGVLIALLLFIISLTSAIISSQSSFHLYQMGLKVKTMLSSAIYRKSLKISFSNRNNSPAGELMNLMAVDTFRIYDSMSNIHTLWEGPLVIAITGVFLYQRMGLAAVYGLSVLFVCIPITVWIIRKLFKLQKAQMKYKDQRIKLMNEILNGIKILKLYAWEFCFQAKVEEVRKQEIKELKRTFTYLAFNQLILTFFPTMITFICFALYVLIDGDNVLDSQTVFVVITLINNLCNSMINLRVGLTAIAQVIVSIKRIGNFLACPELETGNVTRHTEGSTAISIRNGVFDWDGNESVLERINLKIEKGSLTSIVGPVGCGKSSLIYSCLGEMNKLSGSVNIDGSVAYVAQQAWIQNATLQENILFGKAMDRQKYHDVVHACALKFDFEMLPGGDQTEIGERGINLSGGQKQRIALARAVYSDCDIYLLDDPISAVDVHVAKHIFHKVIGPKGLLAGKTRLLATHAVSFLPQMDMIYVIVKGKIHERGSYAELIQQRGEFSEFLLKNISELDDEEKLNQIRQAFEEQGNGRDVFERAISVRSTTSASSKRRSIIIEDNNDVMDPVFTQTEHSLIEKESSIEGTVNLKVYLTYFKLIGPIVCCVAFTLLGLNEAFSVFGNLWMTKWTSDKNAVQSDRRDYYVTIFGLLGVGRVFALFFGWIVLNYGVLNSARKLHNNLLATIIRLPMSFFDTTPLGRILNRFSKDIDVVDICLPQALRLGLLFFFNVCGLIVAISLSNPHFVYVLFGFAVIYCVVQKFYIHTSRQLKRIESVTLSPLYSHFSESLAGLVTIRAFDKQQEFISQNSNKIDWNQKCTYSGIVANRWLSCRLETMASLLVLCTSMFAVFGRRGDVDPAIYGLSISYALNATVVFNYFVRMMADIETHIVAVERIQEYSKIQREPESDSVDLDPLWPSEGKVQFENLKLRYRPGLDSILKGLSFVINPKEKIGIVGRTGAGKSSLTLALFRIIEAAGGKIQIDGINIADLNLHILRKRLTIIPQEPVLFAGTLRMNLDPFGQYSDEAIWKALELSHLKSYVSSLSSGLLFEVTEGGENLSIGQRQLICLARALLRKTKILVLDEATAAVDLETDEVIQNTIRTEFSDCTVLSIAHRLNTIADSDKIVVLEDGEIVEYDTPETLLQDPFSKFHKLARKAGLTRADFSVNTRL